ncbi:alpha-2-macroglobulin family protein [Thermoflexibacter ruber]|uniref:Alpha-2-macroglobulin family N-terminal region n=1 Tax=Thermoflexibacter ruber TaxID=1003 RepID=A0A1I2HTA0_9BACT|nr:alpha-2-macroglobulin family protein [Thermoflexibacter ruber]SFF31956.1 Alpha-2-macroglobulin family N-terminal region [Thermoflexibacter ruber]
MSKLKIFITLAFCLAFLASIYAFQEYDFPSRYLRLIRFGKTASKITNNQQQPTKHQQKMFFKDDKNYKSDWKKVDSLEKKGLVESALKIVDEIYAKAKKDNNAEQIIKAVLYQAKYISFKEEDADVKVLNKLDSEAIIAIFPVKPVLHSVLAGLYWQYYEDNRWRFYNRSETVAFEKKDIATWSLEDIVKETVRQYHLSLEEVEKLKSTKIDIYHEILGGNADNPAESLGKYRNRNLRPTLYDFLAHRAVDFFSNSEPEITRPAYQFQLDKADYFASAKEFAGLKIETQDTLAMKFHAIVLLQDLIKFHLSGDNKDALADADLKRITFVYNHSVHSQKEELYLKALQDFQNRYEGSPIAADAAYLTAQLYYTQGEKYSFSKNNDTYRWKFKEAKDLAEKAIKKYPDTQGANNCQHIIELVQTKSLSLNIEKVSPAQQPQRALVTYRNVPKMYFKIVATDYEELSTIAGYYYNYNEREKLIAKISERKGIKSWNVSLPSDDGDFQAHATEMLVPELPHGYYFLLASDNEGFTYKKNTLVWSHFVVSDLSLVGRTWSEKGEQEFYVLNRTTGKGVPNIQAQTFYRDYNYNSRKYEYKKGAVYTSDKDGYLKLKYTGRGSQRSEYFNIELINGTDKLHTDESFYLYAPYQNTPNPYYKTFFFTDRAIYRPSQTVYFKGILLSFKNKDKNLSGFENLIGLKPEIVKNQTLKVYFYDVNGQKVSEVEVKTNEYGSFSGSFVAPVGSLNGEMTIQTDSYYGGYHSISVEEYKRPKFEVIFEPVKGSYKLGEMVKVEGKAKAYSGASIDNAQVKYRIVRKAKLPYWWWWWYPDFQVSPEMEIGNGTTTTDKNGVFTVDFEAIPDLSLPKSSKPTFTYQVLADVTDLNGETHSGLQSVSIGYTALEIESNIPDVLDLENMKTNFQINSTNLSGEFEPAQGTYTLHSLKTPEKVFRKRLWAKPDKFLLSKSDFYKNFPQDEYENESNLYTWEKGTKVSEANFDTGKDKALILTNLKAGVYVLELTAKDKYGEEVKGLKYFTVYSSKAKTPVYNLAEWVKPLKTKYEVGETAQLCVGTAYQNVPILYEIEIDGTVIKKEWLTFNNEQRIFEIPVTEAMKGNFGVHLTFVQHGRAYKTEQAFSVPHTDKELEISFETFRNKLFPGANEEWKIKIKGKKGDKVAAEMVATLYDASLDAFRENSFNFNALSYHQIARRWSIYTFGMQGSDISALWNTYKFSIQQRYYDNLYLFGLDHGGIVYRDRKVLMSAGAVASPAMQAEEEATGIADDADEMLKEAPSPKKKAMKNGKTEMAKMDELQEEVSVAANATVITKTTEEKPKPEPKLEDVKARTNFNETAFFMPHLETDAEGNVIVKFTIPESLTRWKMLGFAHSQDLKYGFAQNELVTQKDLMVVPNAPRFFRENDEMTFASKITNISDKDLTGKAKVLFFDAISMKPIDADLFSNNPQATSIENIATQNFTVPKGQSTVVKWNIRIPDAKYQAITYRVVAQAGEFTDGEEMSIPVLTNRMLITETLPLPVRGGQTKEYELTKLVKNNSTTLKNHKLTLEFTSNPAWYAIQALPYLMEYPYECAEQTFSRFYANSIASHVANSHPKIKNVFDTWASSAQDGSAFLSNLEKNQELKYLMLQETPWVVNAQNEQARKKQIAVLFDLNRMANELGHALTKLEQMQTPNGGFPWFEGMPDSPWITQHIVAGMGHLDKLGVSVIRNSVSASNKIDYGVSSERTWRMVEKATLYLDDRIKEDYDNLVDYCKRYNLKLEEQKPSYHAIHYLYARSFFKDIALAGRNKKAYDFYLGQAKKYWLGNGLYAEAMLALVHYRNGDEATAKDIVKSLKERSLNSDEMGMYWKNMMKGGYWWYEAPVETQALMIEVFSEVAKDEKAVDDLKVWLLKQKQTQDWKTTKATSEACYALLLQGDNWLMSDELVDVTLGNMKVNPKAMEDVKIEAGTGYFKTSWNREAITPEMGKVTVKKNDKGVAWGGLYWQYFEQLDKITPAETPLKLKKQLFIQENSPTGPVSRPILENTPLKVGDLVKVRIELRVDRAMEYVHMKDMRAAGFEPVNVISSYKYQDGLGYYETTKDAATNFFFGYLGQGTYVFEYDLRVSHAGDFSNGVTTIQCMYAPEFSSHSEGVRVRVKE